MKKLPLVIAIFTTILLCNCETEQLETTVNETQKTEPTNLTTQSSKTDLSNNWYYILNKNGQCLSVETSNNDVVIWPYWGGSSQKWYLQSVNDYYYRLSPGHNTSLALNIAGEDTENGGDAIVYQYVGQHNEHFRFINNAGAGYYTIKPRHSNKVLDYYKSSGDVVQWDYWKGDKQKWILIPAGGNGQLSWRWATTNVPSDARSGIETAMNAAIARYNKWGNWPSRTLTVEYTSSVDRADASPNGNIRFGTNPSFHTERTALHEIAHTAGVGFWESNLTNSTNDRYIGERALAVYRSFEGKTATMSIGGSHFWNYGLNQETEGSEVNKDRHAQIVWAMRCDGMITY